MTSLMTKKIKKITIALTGALTGMMFLGVSSAAAFDRPDPCEYDHDHRSHSVNYYDYYKKDKYYRAGPYRGAGFTISFGNRNYAKSGYYRDGYSDYRSRRGDRHRKKRYKRNRGAKLVRSDYFRTKYDARILLTEKVFYNDYGKSIVCSVKPVGYEAEYIPYKRLKRVAHKNCSYGSKIKILH